MQLESKRKSVNFQINVEIDWAFFFSKFIYLAYELNLGVVYAIKVLERKPMHMESLSLIGDARF